MTATGEQATSRWRWLRAPLVRKVATYAGGSVVAAGCSELTLVVLYGLLHVPPGPTAVVAWIAGAIPNYWLNRAWTWQQRGRPDFKREVLPYVVIVLVTLLLAVACTKGMDAWLRHEHTSSVTRVTAVAITFQGVYVLMFALRFVLLDRLFSRLAPEAGSTPARPPTE